MVGMDQTTLLQSAGRSSDILYSLACAELEPPPESVLDLGCGEGSLLRLLQKRGVKILAGCDGHRYSDFAADGIDFVAADLNIALPIPDSSFSAVTAIEVIEHLENPRHLIREVHRILRPGGVAIVSTPNNEALTSFISLLFRGYFSSFGNRDYPAHITPVLKIDLERMLRETGFKDIRVRWSDAGRIPGSDRRWQGLSRFLFRGRLFSDNLLMTARKA